MLDDSLVPEAVRVINDRQGTLLVLFCRKDWWKEQLAEVMMIASPGSHDASRQPIPEDAISILHSDDHTHPIGPVMLCLDPANHRWWIEGIDKKEGGCFFLSESIHWPHINKDKIA